tara:strand:+ start:9897 stop:11972 length:2076 start_codon:yes stop_codon:yes gene_type:complete
MAIKIYETQVRPTTELAERPTTPGMRISQATAAQIGTAIKGAAQTATKLYAEIETRKSENEVLERTRELLEGNENFEGLSMAVEKASMMADPDEAVNYYTLALEKAKINVGSNFKHRFSKKLFDSYLKKQEIKDGIVVRKNSNARFIEKSQALELENIEKLKKDVVYGETQEIKDLALNDLNNILNSSKFENLFGPKSVGVKQGAFEDMAFYQAKREIDVNPEQGLANAKKNKLINLDNYEKLKAYAGKNRETTNETAKETLKVMEGQLSDFSIPDIATLETIINNAVAVGDDATIQRANKILVQGQVLSELKTMNYQELQQANSAAYRLKEGATPETVLRSEVIRDFYNEISSNLKKDPLTTARNIGVFNNIGSLPITDLLNNPDRFDEVSNSISERIIQAKAVSSFYGIQTKFFTEDEKAQLVDFFDNNRNKNQLVRVLATINKTFGKDAGRVFSEIAPKNKFFAYIGGLANQTGVFGEGFKKAVSGYDIVKNKKIDPGIKKSESTYKKNVAEFREAFPNNPETYDAIIEAAEYIYAYEMYIKGETDVTFKPKIFKEAIQLAAGKNGNYGGIDEYNNTFISIPSWMKQGQFSDVVDQLKDNPELFKQALGNQEGVSASRDGAAKAIDIFKNNPNPAFVAVGNGRYMISMTDHPFKGNPRYVMTKNFDIFKGTQVPLILDLNLIKSKIQE